MKIVIVMITKDRTAVGRKNYFSSTMESFEYSGLFCSHTPFEFHVFDGGSLSFSFLSPWDKHPALSIHKTLEACPPNENAGRALAFGGGLVGVDWVVFIEDDIEVCFNFLDGVSQWLCHYESNQYKLFTFYTPYREVEECYSRKVPVWYYPIQFFYGTQAFALRSEDAYSLGEFLIHLPSPTSSYDLAIKQWAYENSSSNYFLASVPCFCQHVGKESLLFTDPARFHQCGSYLGRDWQFKL